MKWRNTNNNNNGKKGEFQICINVSGVHNSWELTTDSIVYLFPYTLYLAWISGYRLRLRMVMKIELNVWEIEAADFLNFRFV